MANAFCENCGTKREADAKFCIGCGARLNSTAELSETTTGPDQLQQAAQRPTEEEKEKAHIYGADDLDFDEGAWEPDERNPGLLNAKRVAIFALMLVLAVIAYFYFAKGGIDGDRYDVAASTLNCRKEPNAMSEVVGQFVEGEQVAVTDRQGDWSKVTFENQICWVSAEFLRKLPDPVAIINLDEASKSDALISEEEGLEFEKFEPSFRLEYRVEVLPGLLGDRIEKVYYLTNDGDAAGRVKWVAINRRSECLAVPILNRDKSGITSLSVLTVSSTAAVADFVKLEIGQSIALRFPQECGRLIHLEIGEQEGTYEIRNIFS